jgi:hypothetical protein
MLDLHRSFIKTCSNFRLKRKKDLSKSDSKWILRLVNLKECKEDAIQVKNKKFFAKI